jgi:hypothetical protein
LSRALVVGPGAFRPALGAALDRLGVEVVRWSSGRAGLERLAQRTQADAILVIAPARGSAAALVPAPVLAGVPVGLLPADSPAALAPWLAALGRPPGAPVWAVLAEWEQRYLRRARSYAARLAAVAPGRRVRRWLADRLNGEALLERLACAPRWITYFGHASGEGLGGYFGVRAAEVLAQPACAPTSVFWCWACRTLGHARGGAFGARLVLAGRVAAFVGSVDEVRSDANEALAALASEAMAPPPASVGELMRRLDLAVAARRDPALTRAWHGYRLLGNPLAGL